VILPRVGGDFGKLMHALGSGRLAEHVAASPVRFEPRAYVSVAVCAAGYPGAYERGKPIEGLDRLPESVYAFHAGTLNAPAGGVLTNGGRVLHIVGGGDTVAEARERAYAGARAVKFEGAFFRSDIALREV
jgi:phosphoribosylamine--glycine ligase